MNKIFSKIENKGNPKKRIKAKENFSILVTWLVSRKIFKKKLNTLIKKMSTPSKNLRIQANYKSKKTTSRD